MKKQKISSHKKNLKKKILNKKFSKFGFLSELDETQLEAYALPGHPICSTPIYGTTCSPPTYVLGGPYGCLDGSTTFQYCAS